MSTFGIFALILTTGYIIYYGVVITRDILSSRKNGEDSSEEEHFDTTFMVEEPTAVSETVDEESPATGSENSIPTDQVETAPSGGTASDPSQIKGAIQNFKEKAMSVIEDEVYGAAVDDQQLKAMLTQTETKHSDYMIARTVIAKDCETNQASEPSIRENM